jgi:hypothetical protein
LDSRNANLNPEIDSEATRHRNSRGLYASTPTNLDSSVSDYIVCHMAAGGSRRYQPTVQTNLCVSVALATRKNGFDELLHPPVM